MVDNAGFNEAAGRALLQRERAAVLAAATICGAAVMEVELLGARVVGPWFGVSFFVWTALITVTLLSLAAGYYLGGRVSDRRSSLKTLSFLIGAAGLLLLAVPLARAPILRSAVHLGVRGGALVSATILFGPPLVLLGTVTPFAVKLFLKDVEQTGRTVGRLSALSTFGSFLGTLATGFYVIPAFHVDQIVAGTAVILLTLSAAAFVVSGGNAAAMLLPIPGLFLCQPPPLADLVQKNGTRATVICREESFYGQITVVDYSFAERHTREMLIDGIIQGGIDVNDGRPIYAFPYHLEQAALAQNPAAKRALVIGLGPASMPGRLSRYGLTGDVVEIDPKVTELAERYFGFSQKDFPVTTGDGRTFLDEGSSRYDIVLLDAFSAENEPAHLLTREAFSSIRRRLNPGGTLAINLSGVMPGPGVENRVVDTVLRTLAEVFPLTRAHFTAVEGAGEVTNYTLVAALPADAPPAPFSPLPAHPMAESSVVGFLATNYQPPARAGEVYSDAWAPVEFQSAESKLRWRELEIATTPAEVLLN